MNHNPQIRGFLDSVSLYIHKNNLESHSFIYSFISTNHIAKKSVNRSENTDTGIYCPQCSADISFHIINTYVACMWKITIHNSQLL